MSVFNIIETPQGFLVESYIKLVNKASDPEYSEKLFNTEDEAFLYVQLEVAKNNETVIQTSFYTGNK